MDSSIVVHRIKSPSELESRFLATIQMYQLPMPEREVGLIPGRRFRTDMYWPQFKLAVELDGGTWINGRHSRGTGYENDARKQNLLVLQGIRVLRFTSAMVDSWEAARTVKAILEGESGA